ncbi:MAG: arginase family protein, partial [Eudoraea sp.]|nr:arginase family protein [Eudoraea sp.]
DRVYLTIDLDGFSSAYAPGVSAASPFGFDTQIALWTLQIIIASGKLISMDLAEMNPVYDQDRKTAKLAAGILHHVLRHPQLL